MKSNQNSFSSTLSNENIKVNSFRNSLVAFSLLFFVVFFAETAFSQTGTQQILRLQVSSGTISDETIIVFMENATDGFDIYDSPKMSNNNDSIPEIYTLIGNEEIVINSMPPLTVNNEIPLAFRTGLAGTFKIINNEFANFPNGTTVKLINNLNGQEQIISDGIAYSFTSEAITKNDMFTVKIVLPDTTVVDPDPDPEPEPTQNITFTVNSNNRIVITCNEKIERNATVAVYNAMTGKLVFSGKLNKSITVINKKLPTGVYTVVVKNAGIITTGKVMVGI